MLLNDNNNLIKKVNFFYDSKNTNMAGPPSSQSELSYEHTYIIINSCIPGLPTLTHMAWFSRIWRDSHAFDLLLTQLTNLLTHLK